MIDSNCGWFNSFKRILWFLQFKIIDNLSEFIWSACKCYSWVIGLDQQRVRLSLKSKLCTLLPLYIKHCYFLIIMQVIDGSIHLGSTYNLTLWFYLIREALIKGIIKLYNFIYYWELLIHYSLLSFSSFRIWIIKKNKNQRFFIELGVIKISFTFPKWLIIFFLNLFERIYH